MSSKAKAALSLIRTSADAELVIAQAKGLSRVGRNKEALAMLVDLTRSLARAIEDPESAAIGELVGLIADAQNMSEPDVYLELQRLAGETEPSWERDE